MRKWSLEITCNAINRSSRGLPKIPFVFGKSRGRGYEEEKKKERAGGRRRGGREGGTEGESGGKKKGREGGGYRAVEEEEEKRKLGGIGEIGERRMHGTP